jgi:UDP-N-acetyl-D-glucosamine dehydrogenase
MNTGPQVVVVGLGYAGLPLAVAFAEAGVEVVGLDVAPRRVEMLGEGISYIDDIPDERLDAVVRSGAFSATVDPACLERATDIVICVPTPLTRHRIPDMRPIESAARTIAAWLRPGQLVVLESTTYPGTTEEVVKPLLEAGGLRAGADFALGYSPERIDPGATGSGGYTLRNTPKLVSGLTDGCIERAAALYSRVVDCVVPVGSPRIAEMAKLFENIFRNVNLALVNELSMLCDRMDLDVWEVLDAAATKPFGFMRFNPSPGVGGHCIPVDPFYLTWKAREYGMHTRFIELAGEINENMPRHVVGRVIRALNGERKSLNGSRILALGVAYKANVSDMRGSPALTVIEGLRAEGAAVFYHDPHVPEVEIAGAPMRSVPLTAEEIAAADCVVVLTDHAGVDYGLVARHAPLVVDTRNCVHKSRVGDPSREVCV